MGDTNFFLSELKSIYDRYYPFWPTWSRCSACNLPETVLYVIDAQANSGFVTGLDNVMFYNTLSGIKEAIQLLNADHVQFKKWVAVRLAQSLAELRSAYALYQPLWPYWTKAHDCRLSADDIILVNDFIRTGNKFQCDNMAAVYNKIEFLQVTALQLNLSYGNFQEWAVLKFRGSLLWRGINYNLHTFFIIDIDALSLSEELKQHLKKFRVKNLLSLVEMKSQKIITNPAMFMLLMETQAILFEEEIALNKLKRKGGKKKRLH